MSEFHDVEVYIPNNDKPVIVNNVPFTISVYDFIQSIQNLSELSDYTNIRITNGRRILKDDETMIYDSVSIARIEPIFIRMFWIFQALLIASIFYKKTLHGIIAHFIFMILLASYYQGKCMESHAITEIIDGFWMFIISLFPDFHLENAIRN